MNTGIFKKTILLFCIVQLSACSSLSYFTQSISGQLEVLNKRVPVQELLDDPKTPDSLHRKLKLALDARNFASTALHLPDNDSYRSYSDLQRNYVVWNVFAAPEFSLEPKQWCFLVVGCLSYRGYFKQEDAQVFAEGLRKQGYDVYIGGVPAYSTLGWFDDPVLNTMLDWEDTDIIGLVFHELAHQQLYVKDDSAFNESFAMTVELEGMRRWMDSRGSEKQYSNYIDSKKRQKRFVEMVMQARSELEKVYTSGKSIQEKRKAKSRIFANIRESYRELKSGWDGYTGYDQWVSGDLNNAKLSSVAIYHQYVPAFQVLMNQTGGDLQAFYAAARELSFMEKEAREKKLKGLMATSP